jgi:hypothetical protein
MPATTYPLTAHDAVSPAFALSSQSAQVVVVGQAPGTIGAVVVVERETAGVFQSVGSIRVGGSDTINESGVANYRLRLTAYGLDVPATVSAEVTT